VLTDPRRALAEALGQRLLHPISALTHATLDVICTDDGTRAVARSMDAGRPGDRRPPWDQLPVDVDRRIDGARKVGAHKTSSCRIWRVAGHGDRSFGDGGAEFGRKLNIPTPRSMSSTP